MAKRARKEHEDDGDTPTPRKSQRTGNGKELEAAASPAITAAETPSKRKSILRGTPTKTNGTKDVGHTPTPLKKVLFSTPAKAQHDDDDDDGDSEATPTAARNDRSARRKSARTLREQVVDESDVEEDATDARIAAEILDSENEPDPEDSAEESIGVATAATVPAPDTPSKSTKQRGRPKGRRRDRTPTPPPDLPPHELYFFQNRPGANKTSANTLPSHLLLNHEDYNTHIRAHTDPHEADIARLERLHARAFDQWAFELSQNFNLCLYGYGSKRHLLTDFATHLHHTSLPRPKILVINGYTPGLTIRDILLSIATAALPSSAKDLPTTPAALLAHITSHLSAPLTLLLHSLDHPNLRKSQPTLSTLASHPSISLIASVDTPTPALLWPLALLSQFRFLHHDATTFRPYAAELDVVEEVNALLGRSGRRLGGKDGVAYVLKSLPENARNLFRILVAEQLALADTEGDAGTVLPFSAGPGTADSDSDGEVLGFSDEESALTATPSKRIRKGRPAPKRKNLVAPKAKKAAASALQGVEYRHLYHKAVEEFVCSSEVAFRTLLKEFHDHRMVESGKDGAGVERLGVPFGREELEGWLGELA